MGIEETTEETIKEIIGETSPERTPEQVLSATEQRANQNAAEIAELRKLIARADKIITVLEREFFEKLRDASGA
jgi:hypothetical protein